VRTLWTTAKWIRFGSAIMGVWVVVAMGQASAQESLAGDPEQGRALFFERNCVACHGYSGETGTPLLPLRLPQQAFIVIVRTSPTPAMPAYPDLSPEQVAHMYAYLESVIPSSPEIDEIEFLNNLRNNLSSEP
jgi:mono/diheme cytochrome c family protein